MQLNTINESLNPQMNNYIFLDFPPWESISKGINITKVESTCNFITFINKTRLKTRNYFQRIKENSKSIKKINIPFQLF